MRIVYMSVFDILRAGVDGAGSSTKTPFRSACKTVCCIYLPAYAG